MNKIKMALLTLLASTSIVAQEKYNPISTTVAFLNIAPESRGSALGDAGAATSPDAYSQYWNAAKYAFAKDDFGFGFSYTPWLRSLVNDIGLIDLTGYYRFDEYQTISSSLRYFTLGEIQGTDEYGNPGKTISPNEYAFDLGYSRKFSDNWSGAVVFRFIQSDLYSGAVDDVYPGYSFAVDMATYYNKEDIYVGGYPSKYAFGVNISNLGRKISYDKGINRLFLPTNLKIGGYYEMEVDNYNSVAFTLDINKLMVPTPDQAETEDPYHSEMSSLEGVFKSFADAPGGFQEELQEIMFSAGLEYVYDQTFAVRGGYFYEHETKGNREYFAAGCGFKMNVFSLDVSYLVPFDADSPLANTLRFSLSFGVDGLKTMFQ